MSCGHDPLIAADDALVRLLERVVPLATEVVALDGAVGRVLATPAIAPRSRPTRALAAMDGYAIREADLEPMRVGLKLAGASYPGDAELSGLSAGLAIRITTGAPLPPGADRVVMSEQVTVEGDRVRLIRPAGAKSHVRAIGSDFGAGDVLAPAGVVLTPAVIMACAATEASLVEVVRRPRVALVVTGDEIASPQACAAAPDRVPDSVSFGVSALARTWGAGVVTRHACPDDAGALLTLLRALEGLCDIVVLIGGASGSERDHARGAAAALGARPLFAGVAMRPGKPVWAAALDAGYILGLPGNPTAALVTARLFLAPLVARMSGRGADPRLAWRVARLAGAAPLAMDREVFLLGRSQGDTAVALARQDSSGHSSLASADVLIRTPADARRAGWPAEVLILDL